jgi:hypothetical protein
MRNFTLSALLLASLLLATSCGEHGFLDDILFGGDSSSSEGSGSGGGTSSGSGPSGGGDVFVSGSCVWVEDGATFCFENLSNYRYGASVARQICSEDDPGTYSSGTACPAVCTEIESLPSEGLVFYSCPELLGGSL